MLHERVQMWLVVRVVRDAEGSLLSHDEYLTDIDDETGDPIWTRERIDAGVWSLGIARALREYVRPFSDLGYVLSHYLRGAN